MSPARLVSVLRLQLLAVITVSAFFTAPAHAQQDYLLQLGTPPGSPTMPIPMGVLNLKNGNVHMEFPLKTLVQRNGLKIQLKLMYDSSNCYWMYGGTPCQSGWREVYSPLQYGDTPFPPYVQTSGNYVQCPTGGPNGGAWYTQTSWSNFSFTDASGSGHLMNVYIDNSGTNCENPPGAPISTAGYAFDSSGYYMVLTLSSTTGPPTWQVWDKHGDLMGVSKDTNGNTLSSTDELGRSYSPDRRLTSFLSLAGATWNFAYVCTYNPHSPPSSPWATTVTAPPDPLGVQNQTVYSFTAQAQGPNGTTPWSAKYYAGTATGTPLRETDVVLDSRGAQVQQQTTILDNGVSSKTVWGYQSAKISLPGSSNITSKQEYDFSGNLARETDATYQTNTTYTGLNITDLPLTVKVYGLGGAASGPLMAQTNYSYDGLALFTTSGFLGTSVIGSTGHDDTNYASGSVSISGGCAE